MYPDYSGADAKVSEYITGETLCMIRSNTKTPIFIAMHDLSANALAFCAL